jgi:hypothetical protein
MNGIEEIEKAIDRLPPDDVRRIAKWLRDRESQRESPDLEAGYRSMAFDAEREREALEWSEGLIGDATGNAPDAPR